MPTLARQNVPFFTEISGEFKLPLGRCGPHDKVRNVPTGGQPVEKENLQLVSAGYHLPRLKIRCPRKSRRQHLPIDHTFHLMGIIVPLPGKNYTVLFASGLQI